MLTPTFSYHHPSNNYLHIGCPGSATNENRMHYWAIPIGMKTVLSWISKDRKIRGATHSHQECWCAYGNLLLSKLSILLSYLSAVLITLVELASDSRSWCSERRSPKRLITKKKTRYAINQSCVTIRLISRRVPFFICSWAPFVVGFFVISERTLLCHFDLWVNWVLKMAIKEYDDL
jgi:hypothetical protein